jgi:hypothetical protein
MSNGYREFKEDVGYFALGAGVYLILMWIFAFFPAFIISLQISRWLTSVPEDGQIWCLILLIIGTFIIIGLFKAQQYFIVLMLYVITAWPFLYILWHYLTCGGGDEFPLPLDWWPLW